MTRFYTLIGACIHVSSAKQCSDGDNFCQALLGRNSSCIKELGVCSAVGEDVIPCECGIEMSPSMRGNSKTASSYVDFLENEGDEPHEYVFRILTSESTGLRPRPPIGATSATTARPTTTRPRTTTRPPTTAKTTAGIGGVGVSTTRTTTPSTSSTRRTTTPTTRTTTKTTTPTTRTTTKTTTRTTRTTTRPTTSTTRTTTTMTTTRTTTVEPSTTPPSTTTTITTSAVITTVPPFTTSIPSGDNGGMFVWAEWPSMWGEPDWKEYYAKLVSFVETSPLNVTKVILRVLDPIYGTVATTEETTHDLWTVSTDSVLYTDFLTKAPSTMPVFELYPYLMDVYNQERWKSSMNTSKPLEATFKFCAQWNELLQAQGLKIRCAGVTVDGEERRGYVTELPMVSTYKAQYGGLTFGYSTGYSQVGVLGTHDGFVDDFYFQLYDFYVRGVYPAQLVQNTDVAVNDVSSLITVLNKTVWYQQMPYYEHPKARFMWSVQHSSNGDCLYPLGPSNCGAKEDFGAWTLDGFLTFVETVKTLFPTKFGNKGHGIFQFSLIPNSWVQNPK